jgi:hypothetical protein
MDPPECSGHSHDHDHGDDLGISLRPQIDFPGVTCLNENRVDSGRSILKLHEERLSSQPQLVSQDDPELLLYIPFTEAVTAQSISIRSVSQEGGSNDDDDAEAAAPPRRVRIFTNKDNLDFETAREMDAQMELELLPPHHFTEGTIDYPLRPAGRFQGISSLTMFVQDNYGDNDDTPTVITHVGVKGKGSGQKRMAVETVYESRGMKKDHKVKGEFGNTTFL